MGVHTIPQGLLACQTKVSQANDWFLLVDGGLAIVELVFSGAVTTVWGSNGSRRPMKRLYRIKRDAKLAGVCVGVGEHFDTDPNLVRILWIGSCFFSGIGFGLYLAAWLLLPEKPPQLVDHRATSQSE